MVNALRYYPNVHMRNVNMYNYSIGTLAERWIKKDLILKSQYFADHLAAFLRLLTLYKYGGIHMGKDFVVQRNFDDLAPNFAGIEGSEGAFSISHGLFGFDSAEVGHSIIDMILRFVQVISFTVHVDPFFLIVLQRTHSQLHARSF